MKTHVIEQIDQEGIQYNWIAIDEHTARELYEIGVELYFVRGDAEGRIDNEGDLNEAIECDAVCVEDTYNACLEFIKWYNQQNTKS